MQIRRLFKGLIIVLATLLVASVTFYFWASSANHPQNEYSRLITNALPVAKETDSTYRIITYNMGYLSGMTNNLPVARTKKLFDDNLQTVSNNLGIIRPDIICLQEIDYHSKRSYNVNQQEELAKLGYNYVFQAVNWDVNYLPFPYLPLSAHFGEIYSGQSILSKYPFSNPERIVLADFEDAPFYRKAFYLDRLAQVVKIRLADKMLILINVHLEAFDRATRAIQTTEVVRLYNSYKNDYPVLLVGDFNSDINKNNATIEALVNLPGIKHAVPASAKTYPSNTPAKKLDYIFYNEQFIEIKSSGVLTTFAQASDHLPVMMEFMLK